MEVLLMLALAVQVVTEGVARVYPKGTVYVAAVVGVVVAFLANVGLLQAAFGITPVNHLADVVLAGLVLGGGSGLLDSLKQFAKAKTGAL